jgi:xanthine dehydrogenase accessory factor
MKEVLSDIDRWRAEGNMPIALATVIETWGSAPRKVGAKMAVRPDGAMVGSVSGGCVEGAVVEAATETLADGRPQLLEFGVADETAWEVGLACGGHIKVWVEPLDTAVYPFIRQLISNEQAGACVTILDGPDELVGRKMAFDADGRSLGHLGGKELEDAARAAGQQSNQSRRVELTVDSGQLTVDSGQLTGDSVAAFVDVYRPAPTLVMVGGVHIAVALTRIAQTLGYRTIVVDPRRAFGSQDRFPHVDQLIQAWPQKAFAEIKLTGDTAVALLTHDPKIDDPALHIVLKSSAFYVGALGSNKTHAKRKQRLSDHGFDTAVIDRIYGPIGLDIGADNPEEIALAVMAQIVKAYREA